MELAISPNKQGLQIWAQVYLTTHRRIYIFRVREQSQSSPHLLRPEGSLPSGGDIPLCYRHTLQS